MTVTSICLRDLYRFQSLRGYGPDDRKIRSPFLSDTDLPRKYRVLTALEPMHSPIQWVPGSTGDIRHYIYLSNYPAWTKFVLQ